MIKNKVQSKVAKAFNTKLIDAVTNFTCSKQVKSGVFDYATQTYPVITAEVYSGRGVLFGSYLKDLVKPTEYQTTDSKAVVLQNEITSIPQISDTWTTAKGLFKVISIAADPTDSIWICQLRKL